jgi:hypothetical protein
VEVTAPVVLVFGPTVVPVTVTLNTQVPLPTMVAPVNVMVLGLVVVSEPPQVVVGPDVATVNPAGSTSVNPTPVSASAVLGFVIVNVNVEVPLSAIIVGLNALLIDGGASTVMLAVAVLPCGVSFEVTLPLVLFFTPAVVPFTSTLIVHVPLADMAPPVKVSVVSVAAGVNVPPQVVLALGVAATSNPDGSASVNATPVRATVVFGLVMVNVSVEVPPIGIVAALNDLLIDTGPITVSVAVLLAAPAPLSVELIAPVVLFHTPVVDPITVTLNWHIALAARVPPLNVIVLGAVVVTEPPLHSGVGPELATVTPAGNVSVKLIPVRPLPAFGLVMVKVSEVVPPS